jgi:hypothetical protein
MGEEGSAESKRERSREAWRRERENGEKRRNVGPVTVINWDPHEFSPDLNPAWIQKQVERVFSNLAWDPHKIQVGISILT